MELSEEVGADLRVAAVAAGCTVALTLALQFGFGVTTSPLLRIAPLAMYFAYLFLGKGPTGSGVENARLWMLATVLVTVGTGVYALV